MAINKQRKRQDSGLGSERLSAQSTLQHPDWRRDFITTSAKGEPPVQRLALLHSGLRKRDQGEVSFLSALRKDHWGLFFEDRDIIQERKDSNPQGTA